MTGRPDIAPPATASPAHLLAEKKGRPLPFLIRGPMRAALRAWASSGYKSSVLFRVIERWGARLAAAPMVTRLPNGCDVVCDLGDFVQRQLYFRGTFEPIESYLFCKLLRPGMVVIDVGANIGQYTMLASTCVGDDGQVHSFEPVPANFALLERNVREDHLTNVRLNRHAAWNEDATLSMALPRVHLGNAGAYEVETASGTETIEVRALALDRYAAMTGLRRVDVIKLDIQGSEARALAGARGLLATYHPTLLMEVSRKDLVRLGSSPDHLFSELRRFGYRAWRIGSSLRSSGPAKGFEGELANFFFHHEDLPQSVVSGWNRRDPKRWACSGWGASPARSFAAAGGEP